MLKENNNKGTVIKNVADGEVSSTSNQAVNGKQLHATEQKVEKIVKEELVPVKKEVNSVKERVVKNTETLAKHSSKFETYDQAFAEQTNRINENTRVVNENTRVVKQQVEQVNRNTRAIAQQERKINENTKRIENLEQRSQKDRQESRAGVAGAMAMTQIHPVPGKRFSIGAGAGTFRGESAVAVGIKYAPTKNVVLSLSSSADTRGGFGAATGVSVGFD